MKGGDFQPMPIAITYIYDDGSRISKQIEGEQCVC